MTRFLLEAPRQISETEHVALFREPDPALREAIIRVTSIDTTPDYSDVIVQSGDPAFTDQSGVSYFFGGRLDSNFQPLNQPGNTFRGVTTNGGYVTFYGAMVTTFEPASPFEPVSNKIGLFRADISGPTPVIEAIAVHGELVSQSLCFIPTSRYWMTPPGRSCRTIHFSPATGWSSHRGDSHCEAGWRPLR